MREDITIRDAAKARIQAENAITQILRKFAEDTGLIPTNIDFKSEIRRYQDGSMVISSMKVSIEARV